MTRVLRQGGFARRVLGVAVAMVIAVPLGATSVAASTAGATGLTRVGLGSDGAPSAVPAPRTGPLAPSAWERALGRRPSVSAAPSTTLGVPGEVATITVVPSTDLVSGQSVAVTGTGFAPGELAVAECVSAPTGPESCDLRTVNFISPDLSGAVSTSLVVSRTLLIGGAVVHCVDAVGRCTLIVTNIGSSGIDASAPLGFDPSPPRPNPELTSSPDVELVDGQTVTVSGTGFRPRGLVEVRECVAGVPFCIDIGDVVTADAAGDFDLLFTVKLHTTGALGVPTTCLVAECLLQATDREDLEYVASVPIAFDPDQPVPGDPSITVTPDSGLRHDQAVAVVGSGFAPNQYIDISQCPATESDFCVDFLIDLEADAAGGFETSVEVSRLVSTFDFSTGDQVIVDCVVVQCLLVAVGYSDDEFGFAPQASAPIDFDESEPAPVLPVVTVEPTDNLPYRAKLTVRGTGFAPGEQVFAEFCAAGPNAGFCSFGSLPGFPIADASGAVTFEVSVRRISGFPEPGIDPIDCVDAEVECSVLVFGEHSYERFEFAVTFDPNAPIPPPPTATVTPNTDLGYRESVAIHGSGFVPGPLTVSQCGIVEFPESDGFSAVTCTGYAAIEAGTDGRIDLSFDARRLLAIGFDDPLDCAAAPEPCFLRIGGFEFGEYVDVPLGFDPNSVAPPPPAVKVSPRTHLQDGDVVSVRGSRFTPNANLVILVCDAADSSLEVCDFSNPQFRTADEDGRVSTTTRVSSRLESFNGPFDCAVGPGTCVLAVVNLDDFLESSLTPLSFGPWLDVHGTKVREGTGGNTPAPVVVDLSEATNRPVDVHWHTVAGTATAGEDFIPIEGVLTIPAGETEAALPAEVIGDALDEPTEQFRVEITGVAGAVIEDDSATVKIRDDDDEPEVSIGDATVTEGDEFAKLEVLLSNPSGRALRVEYRTHHGSARSGTDFVRKHNGLKFAPGVTRHVIRIAIVDDAVHEPTESFRVELDDAEDADIDDDTGTVTIVDRD